MLLFLLLILLLLLLLWYRDMQSYPRNQNLQVLSINSYSKLLCYIINFVCTFVSKLLLELTLFAHFQAWLTGLIVAANDSR